jgi:signal transduction histidine kinase
MPLNYPDYTLLIVDDNPTNLAVITDYLDELGFETMVASDGESALQRTAHSLPDLILLDVMMPGMNGFEVCRRLKNDPITQEIPVIFMTALASTEDKVTGFTAGGVDYVTKPIQQEEVLARVTTHLRIRDLTRQLQTLNQNLELLVEQRTAELNHAYQKLEKLDRVKADFIEVAGHELRSPLTLIKGYAQILSELNLEEPNAHRLLDGIISGQERLAEIVNSLLDASQLEGQTMRLSPGPVHLARVIDKACKYFADALRERRLSLIVEDLETLPGIIGDANLLYKVFYHLLMNAIKYTPDGGEIAIRGRSAVLKDGRPAIEIIISDTGIGIDPQDRELIFEKFYQTGKVSLHSSGRTKFKGGGPGLGLAIARGVIVAHDGKIWAESPGYDEKALPGSQFHVILPITIATKNA